MVVCNFFIQGRCRYGDKCWNEHPSGGNAGSAGGGGGSRGGYNSRPPSNRGGTGGGGFGNRVWVNPSQRSGANYVQPSSFSREGGDWGGRGDNWTTRENGGERDNVKSSEFSFSSQNRFSALNNASTFDEAGREGPGDDIEKHLETIQKDMDIWETSGQWVFSCYSVLKATISGFRDHSPEELRLEYYNNRTSGDQQGYANGIIQLTNEWRRRVQELKTMNAVTRVAMLAELNNPVPQATSEGFGSVGPGFGSSSTTFGAGGFGAPAQPQPSNASSFSFAAPSAKFSSSATQAAPTGFSVAAAVTAPPPSGFGSFPASSAPSASSFSFAAPVAEATKAPVPAAFGGSASGFSFASTANSRGGFGVATPSIGGNNFGQTSVGSLFEGSTTGTVAGTGSTGGLTDSLFTSQSELTPEELSEFGAKRFSLGQIPLKPPPANMLAI